MLAEGAGLLECTRRRGWALNTVKRYARAERVEELLRPPRYSACLVDLVRRRLAEKIPVTRILAEIREHGYTSRANLLVGYINQGRTDPERVAPAPRRLVAFWRSPNAGSVYAAHTPSTISAADPGSLVGLDGGRGAEQTRLSVKPAGNVPPGSAQEGEVGLRTINDRGCRWHS